MMLNQHLSETIVMKQYDLYDGKIYCTTVVLDSISFD